MFLSDVWLKCCAHFKGFAWIVDSAWYGSYLGQSRDILHILLSSLSLSLAHKFGMSINLFLSCLPFCSCFAVNLHFLSSSFAIFFFLCLSLSLFIIFPLLSNLWQHQTHNLRLNWVIWWHHSDLYGLHSILFKEGCWIYKGIYIEGPLILQ